MGAAGGDRGLGGPRGDKASPTMLTLLRHVYNLGAVAAESEAPKGPQSELWDTLIDSFVMALQQQVRSGVVRGGSSVVGLLWLGWEGQREVVAAVVACGGAHVPQRASVPR